MADGLFNGFVQQHRPLSVELWRRVDHLNDTIRRAKTVDDLSPLMGENLVAAIEEVRPAPPKLLGTRPASQRPGDWRWNAERTFKTQTTRHFVAVGVAGDIELLRFWPDHGPSDLLPVDSDTLAEVGGLDELAFGTPEDVSRYWDMSQIWTIGAVADAASGLEFCLYTHLDLTRDEERAVARREKDVAAVFQKRREFIAPIVEALAKQIEVFFTTELPDRVREVVAAKREELEDRAAVSESLVFPDEWRAAEPTLAQDGPSDPESAADDSSKTAGGEPNDVDRLELGIDRRAKLSAATFTDVQTIMRLWADAVERYPTAFGALDEDRISDLLTATLNATLPGAQREVYTRAGKSDIFVQADVLSAGRGPAKVFICEAKWATSHAVIRRAVDPQLFGYLNVHDTAAVVLVLMKQKNFAAARRTYLAVLESVTGHESTKIGPVEGWPILQYRYEGKTVEVCAAFVHLTP